MSEPTATFEQVAQAADRLTNDEKARLMEHLRLALEKAMLAKVPSAPGWPPDFFERTYGILIDDPIERPPQGELEERDEIA